MRRPIDVVLDDRADFVSFALPQQTVADVREVAAAARRMWYRARRIKALFRLIVEEQLAST